MKNRDTLKKTYPVLCAVSIAVSCAMADARDGLRHWWRVKDSNSDGLLQANEVYDAMTVSAATPLVGQTLYQSTDLSAGAKPVCITNDVYMPTMRKNVADDAIHFFNPTNYDGNGKLKINYQALQLPQTASVGCTAATVMVRLKWDGARFKTNGGTGNYNYNLTVYSNNYNPYSGAGWRVGLRCFDSGTSNRFHPYLDYGNQEFGFHYGSAPEGSEAGKTFVINKDVWYDVVYSFRVETVDGNKYVYASVLYRKGDASTAANMSHYCQSRGAVRYTSSWSQYGSSLFAPCIGFHKAGQAVPGWNTFGDAVHDDGFTGSIHEIKVYDRWMSEDDMVQCLGGMDPICSIGSANGSADEFSDANAAAVFEPATMDWSRMRKTLNSSTPSASIRYDLNADNLALPRLVEVRLLKSTAFFANRLRLDMNGRRVGRWTVPANGIVRFILPANRLANLEQDAVTGLYPLTLTLTREGDMSGDIRFDSITVDGAWQLGSRDNSTSGFATSDQTYHAYYYLVGQNDISKLRVSTLGKGAYVNIDLYFCIGDWLSANCGYRLTMKTVGANSAPMQLYLNDMSAAYDGSIAVGGLSGGKTWTLPAGTLSGGGNHIRLHNGGGDKDWVNLDYIRLEPVVPADFKNSDDGFVMIMR